MRYFRYESTNKNLNNTLKEQYKFLTNNEKRILRKEKRLQKIISFVSLIIYIASITVGFCLLKLIPHPNSYFQNFLADIGKLTAALIILVVSGILTIGLIISLWKMTDSLHLSTRKKDILAKACSHLRDYYGIQESYIITKCFDTTDKKFQNHDVCIFVVDDELRITTDLIHGFLHEEKDLGCYAFKKHEITLSKIICGKSLKVEIKANNTSFLLGYKTKSFIEKNFIETD